jgi:DNA-binding NarL/FixJ family response regulator
VTRAPIRVLVVDDHELVRAGLVGVLANDSAYVVVAEAGDGREAIEQAMLHRPDVVVMDLHMPRLGGVAATREILALLPKTAVVVLTMYDDDESVMAALQAGARGYLLKGTARAELRAAVTAAAEGHSVFGPEATATLIDRASAAAAAPPFPALSARERDVLAGMVAGHRPGRIAAQLGVTEKTIRNNISNILVKLDVQDRAAAIDKARKAGLGRPH